MAKKRAHGEGTFYHDTKRGYWQYKLTLGTDENGFSVRKTFYGKTQAEARKKGQAYLKELDGRKINAAPGLKFGDWLDRWLIYYKKDTVKQRSYHDYVLTVAKVPQHLKDRRVCDITPMELQRFINEFSLRASKSAMNKMKIVLRSSFIEAQENGLCSTNPARRLKVPNIAEKPREAFTSAEVAKIIAFANNYDKPSIATAIVTLLLTGLRRGELLGLSWEDLQFDHISVNRALYLENNRPVVQESLAKTAKSIRNVPIIPELREKIEQLPHTGRFIFGTSNGTLMHPSNFTRDYNLFFRKLRAVYPEVRRLSPHCCRHTYATLALMSGANVRVVQSLLGHASIETTALYTHPDEAALHSAIQAMAVILRQDLKQDNE